MLPRAPVAEVPAYGAVVVLCVWPVVLFTDDRARRLAQVVMVAVVVLTWTLVVVGDAVKMLHS